MEPKDRQAAREAFARRQRAAQQVKFSLPGLWLVVLLCVGGSVWSIDRRHHLNAVLIIMSALLALAAALATALYSTGARMTREADPDRGDLPQ